jgi:micrococcal nuclease
MSRSTVRTLLVVALVLAGCAGCAATRRTAVGIDEPVDRPGAAVVRRVVDGDTLIVRIEGTDERVRLIGVDTPESVKPGTPVECFAKEAAAHMGSLLPEGTAVRIERDAEARDRYRRLLAYVYRDSDGLFVNLELVRAGYAQPYTQPPNVAHAAEFTAAAHEARQAGRGLWSACGGDEALGQRYVRGP